MATRSENSLTALKRSVEERMEADRMRDVLLLLEGLVNREEATAKIILDCLYDVGSVHLINQKASCRHLKGILKFIARLSKPVFRFVALRWFKRTCPKLIADWLHTQVMFQKLSDQPSTAAVQEVIPQKSAALVKVDHLNQVIQRQAIQRQEIQRLRFQVRWLTGALIGAIATLGGVTLWLASSFVLESSQLTQQPQSSTLPK